MLQSIIDCVVSSNCVVIVQSRFRPTYQRCGLGFDVCVSRWSRDVLRSRLRKSRAHFCNLLPQSLLHCYSAYNQKLKQKK